MKIQRTTGLVKLFITLATSLLIACDSSTPVEATATESATPAANVKVNQDAPLKVLDISERNKDGKNAIAITFSTAIDTSKDIQPYISITENKKGKVEGVWTLSANKTVAWFLNTEPKHQYVIAVKPGLTGQNNSVLMTPAEVNIRTRQLLASVSFTSKGAILPVNYSSGLPVTTINIDKVDIDFFRVADDQISTFISQANAYGRNGWRAQTLSQYGQLIYSGRFELNPAKNTETKIDINFRHVKALKTPGFYLAVMRPTGIYDDRQITWFSVTDIGLHVRDYDNQLDVHVASLTTGKPLRNVTVSLRDSENRVLQEQKTMAEGLASFAGSLNEATTLIAQTEKEYTLLSLSRPALDLSDYDLGSRPQLPMEMFLYSARDLYRPGETITLSGLLRDADGMLDQTPVLTGQFISANNKIAKTIKWQPVKLGYYEATWEIPQDAPTGNWSFKVSGPLKQAAIYQFNVEEFLPERMKLTLANGNKRTVIADKNTPVEIDVLGEYLYGAPASGNKLSAFVNISHWRKPVETLKDFEFGHSLDQQFTSRFDLDDMELDAEGKGTIIVNNNWQQSQSPLQVNINTSLFESGGRPVTRSHRALIWPEEALIGIRPHFKEGNPEANTPVSFDIAYATLAGELRAVKDVEIALVKEDRQYFWEFTNSDGWHWSWTDKEFTVNNSTITIAEGKTQTVSFPVDWGHYRLEVREPNNNTLSSIRFFAGYNWYYDWKNAENAGAARPDKVTLALDKPQYLPGETAKLKILPPESGEALILVESDRPLWSHRMSVAKEGTELDIPVSSDWASHNIYISALVIEPTRNVKSITPKRSLGLIHLPMDRRHRELNISLAAPEKAVPETQLNTEVSIQRSDGSIPKQTYLTLAAVDVGVLNITDFATPDPFNYFFGKRRYAVDAKDIYSDVIEANRFNSITPKFGGDADLARGGEQPKSDVQIVSLFSGPVSVNAEGKASIPMDLPNFNGAIRLMAVAFNDDSYGKQSQEVTVAAPIVAEIAMPRFMAINDESHIVLDIRNMTETAQELTVELFAESGVKIIATPETNRLRLNPKEKSSLVYKTQATGYQGLASITANVSGKDIDNFSRSWRLGLRPAYPALTHQRQQILKPGETYSIEPELLNGILTDTLAATVSLSPTVNLQIADQVKNLLAYPYGCLEQTSSRAFPLTYATPENRERFGMQEISEEKRFDMMQKGVDRIMKFQKSNGSFGLWDSNSPEEHWLSVYATDFLLSAKEAGVDVPEAPLQKAIKRLGTYLNNEGSLFQRRWSSNSKHYAFSTRAYAGYVLSKVKQAPLGSLRSLYSNKFSHGASGLSQVQLALALINMGDNTNGLKALNSAIENTPSNYDYWGDYGSEIRDLGMMVHLLIVNHQLPDQALELSIKLNNALQKRKWLSTQERISLFLAGIALEQEFTQEWKAEMLIGANKQPIKSLQSWHTTLRGAELSSGFSLTSQHTNALYVNTLVSGYGAKAPKPQNLGISVEREWYTADGKLITPAEVTSGELYLVHLALSSDERSPDALIVNLLPAGFELENQNLEHGIKLDQFKIDGKSISELQQNTQIKYQEFRDDRFVAALELNHYRESHVFFILRAVTPGKYLVPPVLVEDMYRPEIRAVSETITDITVKNK